MDQIFNEIVLNLNDNSALKVSQNLKTLTEKLKTEESRVDLNADNEYWLVLAKIVDNICLDINKRNQELLRCHYTIELITDLFRTLRNSLINCPKSKQSIVAIGSLLDNVFRIFKFIIECHKSDDFCKRDDLIAKQLVLLMKCCLQVLANLLSGSDASPRESALITSHVRNLISFDLFRVLLAFKDKSVTLIASMVFYSCLRNTISNIEHNWFESTQSDQLFQVFNILEISLHQIEDESSEWSLWSIQLFLRVNKFLINFYNHFKDNQKLLLLDIIHDFVDTECRNKSNSESNQLNVSNVEYLTDLFKQSVGDIVKIDSEDNNISEANKFTAIHISKLLSILCELTTIENYLHRLQTDKELMECLVDTLKTIQLLGKCGDSSHFKMISQLKQFKGTKKNDEASAENPVFGFKRDIIRMIANLVYKSRQMQDWVREMDGIPLILDCCNIDAKNPYIMQWSIYAVRNILEDNADNQHLLSRLSANGVLIDDELNEKIGFKNGFQSTNN